MTCKDCTERHLGCHSECEKYRKDKRNHDKEQEQIRKAKASDNDIFACTTAKAVNQKMHYATMRRVMY